MAVDVPDWLQLTQMAAPSKLGDLSVAVGNSSIAQAFTLSPFATGFLYLPFNGNLIREVLIQGGVSAYNYANINSTIGIPQPLVGAVAAVADNPLNVTIFLTNPAPGPAALPVGSLWQLFGAGTVTPVNTFLQPLFVQQAPGVPLPVGALQLKALHISSNLAAAGSVTLLAAVAAQTVTVYGYDLDLSPIGAVVGGYEIVVEDTVAAVVFAAPRASLETAVGQSTVNHGLDIPMGLPLTAGAGIKAVANAGNVGNALLEGTILYTQG